MKLARIKNFLQKFLLGLFVLFFVACAAKNEDQGVATAPTASPTPSVPVYRVKGTISGLQHGNIQLRLNGEQTITVVPGMNQFSFSSSLSSADLYSVLIVQNPTSPNLSCTITNNTGVIASNDIENINIQCPMLNSIVIQNLPTQMNVGTQSNIKALGFYSNGQTRELQNFGVWTSSDVNVAGVLGASVSALVGGNSVIRFSFASLLVNQNLTVSGATLQSLVLTPASGQVVLNSAIQYKLTGTYSDGSQADVTNLAVWSSNSPTIAQVDSGLSKGRASGIAAGVASVQASLGGLNVNQNLNVMDSSVQSLSLSPALIQSSIGTQHSLKVMGVLASGAAIDVTDLVQWSYSDASLAKLTNGQLDLLQSGNLQLTATLNGKTAKANVVISTKTLVSLTASQASLTLPVGAQKKLIISANYDDTSVEDVTDKVSWILGNTTLARIKGSGIARGVVLADQVGLTTIQAIWQGKTLSIDLEVSAFGVSTLRMTPSTLMLPKNLNVPIQVFATYTDGQEYEVTEKAVMTLSNGSAGTFSIDEETKNYFVSAYSGSTALNFSVTATMSGKTVSAPWVITSANLTGVILNPSQISMNANKVKQIKAYGQFSDGGSSDLTELVNWSVDNSDFGSLSNLVGERGQLTSLSEGNLVISAQILGVSGSQTVVINSGVENQVDQGMGLRGTYYANRTLDPVGLRGSRLDATIGFNWATGAAPMGVGDSFSIRWQGKLLAPTSGTYSLCTRSDDGVRLKMSGAYIINNWTDHAVVQNCANFTMTAGQKYPIELDFYENGGYAVVELYWTGPSIPSQIIPRQYLYAD